MKSQVVSDPVEFRYGFDDRGWSEIAVVDPAHKRGVDDRCLGELLKYEQIDLRFRVALGKPRYRGGGHNHIAKTVCMDKKNLHNLLPTFFKSARDAHRNESPYSLNLFANGSNLLSIRLKT